MRTYSIPTTIASLFDGYPGGHVLRDSETPYDPDAALRQYLDDLLAVYEKRLHAYIATPSFDTAEEARLEQLLAEVCKVKRMLHGSIEPI